MIKLQSKRPLAFFAAAVFAVAVSISSCNEGEKKETAPAGETIDTGNTMPIKPAPTMESKAGDTSMKATMDTGNTAPIKPAP